MRGCKCGCKCGGANAGANEGVQMRLRGKVGIVVGAAFWTPAMLAAFLLTGASSAPAHAAAGELAPTPAAPRALAAPDSHAPSLLFKPWINGVSDAEPQ